MKVHRTALALVLTVIAVALPTGAWLIAGGQQLAGTRELKERSTWSHGYKSALKQANTLARAFEELRHNESRRPIYDYQNLYHDPNVVAEGRSVLVSPLARGTVHPLVHTYFQVDHMGRLTIPSLNDQFPELGRTDDNEQCLVLYQLSDVAHLGPSTLIQRRSPQSVGALDVDGQEALPTFTFEEIDARAWWLHKHANEVYRDLKYGTGPPETVAGAGTLAAEDRVRVVVGDLDWATLPVDGAPGLVAMRGVDSPDGLWVQGFVISSEAIADRLQDEQNATTLVPLPTARVENQVVVPIEGTSWGVALDLTGALAEAAAESAGARREFLRTVLFFGLAAALAGALVVALVRQADRLASQRAQFAAAAAHELRTPLAGLRLYSEMLAEGLGDPRRSKKYAQRLAGESERLGRVVTNVLSFTRLERQMLSVDPRPGDLAAAVREVLRRTQPALEEAGAAVELEAPDSLPEVSFDPDAIEHIVRNLLDNAEKYTRDIEARRIHVSLKETAQAVLLSVADNGRGISRALRRRLFRPFVRGEHTGNAEGLGLGLVLVQALASAQGGAIRYSDAPTGGAVFTVSFPR